MPLGRFLRKQFVDVIEWLETGDGTVAWRVPMEDQEIQHGAQLTVRESQVALFVDEGTFADAFGPGLHTLETRTLPLLTNLRHWDKAFQSPFKSDVWFFSTRQQVGQRWGTQHPVTIRDRDFGMVRLRAFGMYAWHLVDPAVFLRQVSGTRGGYRVADLEPQLRNLVVTHMSQAFAASEVPFLDMAASTVRLAEVIAAAVRPAFEALGLALDSLTVENLSLPDELQKRLDERIGMNMVGNLGDYARFQAAQSIPIAAANEGGIAGTGAGLAAGMAMGNAMGAAMGQVVGAPAAPAAPATPPAPPAAAGAAGLAAGAAAEAAPDPAASKFCLHCGQPIARAAKFCPECGGKQE